MKTVEFLKGPRFNQRANDHYVMMEEDFLLVDYASEDWIEQLQHYVARHKQEQVGRLQELMRYFKGDNNIKYRAAKTDDTEADNRISSDFAKYITIFEQGYMLGNPVEYKNDDGQLQDLIKDFSKRNNEKRHNISLKKDLCVYGRAYELLTVTKTGSVVWVKLYKLSPEQTFVIYDDSYERHSLMGVNYYELDYGQSKRKTVIKVYTVDKIYTYDWLSTQGDKMALREVEDHFFNGVPINEYANNEERLGSYESVLDNIDAYDLSQSELANFQQNSNEAILLIKGNAYTGADEEDFLADGRINPNGRLGISLAYKRAKMLILDDNPNQDGVEPDASYLVKSYDSQGAEAYKQRLVNDILRFTFTPDTLDSNFAGVQSGESMKYKMMASDNYREQQEDLFEAGLMRRLRLAVNIWSIKGTEATNYEQINETSVVFTPNKPQNQSELATTVKNLYGIVSDQTVFELLSLVTGVDALAEMNRLKQEKGDEDKGGEPSSRFGEVIAHDQEETSPS
ncbi:phage portal protein [Streptococcus cuniculipharyngis]|uniref:Phage portal protein n=1 Tax=Streptococcus cuniculipharyngis TaxID=1562651 RepID=A0A5C5SFS7_9STRE|nr:phage portal protein [Streptococcus cuniculipharyngis]TWS99152.1 phage portal protein [Streptococcus cuniculipharyngis]